jgi:hypothetical protein
MTRPKPRALPWALSSLLAITAGAGCTPPAAPPAAARAHAHAEHADHGHDHGHGHEEHKSPDSLAEGVERLAKIAADVKADLAAGATERADTAVHSVGHLLEDLQGLLPKEKLSAAAAATATKALDELYECFDRLDTALHAPEGTAESPAEVHASLAERIDAAIRVLKEGK